MLNPQREPPAGEPRMSEQVTSASRPRVTCPWPAVHTLASAANMEQHLVGSMECLLQTAFSAEVATDQMRLPSIENMQHTRGVEESWHVR